MTTISTDWARPPVIEVVLGIQFNPIPDLHNGHLGWFWGEMHDEYPISDDVPPIQAVIESFEAGPTFSIPTIGIRPAGGDSRLRMTSADGSRMIQLQNGWLIANWLKQQGGAYPGYAGVREKFDEALDRWQTFLQTRGLGQMVPSVWEVTYIDHVERGTVWETLEDVPRFLPGLLGPGTSQRGVMEAMEGTWAFRMTDRPGRLQVAVQTARTHTDHVRDVIVVRSTARGPISSTRNLDECLNSGRTAVVETFVSVTSEAARRYWQGGGLCS